MKVRQIVNIIETYNNYRLKIGINKERLKWELTDNGETEKAEQLRKQIKTDKEELGKFLDKEI